MRCIISERKSIDVAEGRFNNHYRVGMTLCQNIKCRCFSPQAPVVSEGRACHSAESECD
jgi:hypothetical protein